MAFNKADVIASAQSYGPKGPNKIVLYVNENKTSGDNKPSLYGYATDKDITANFVKISKSHKNIICISPKVASICRKTRLWLKN